MSTISIIAAIDEKNAIGKQQRLLCHLPNDLKHFKQVTSGHTIVMGRKTFQSLPNGALPNRKNIVLTKSSNLKFNNCLICNSLQDALIATEKEEEVFIIGGASVYKEAISCADKMYLTFIHHTFSDADTFFPEIDFALWTKENTIEYQTDSKNPYSYSIQTYIKKK